MSHALSLTQPTSVRRGRSGVIALWVVQIALAGMFLLAGGSKLVSAPAMVTLLNTIGFGQWFRYVTGLIEVGSAARGSRRLLGSPASDRSSLKNRLIRKEKVLWTSDF